MTRLFRWRDADTVFDGLEGAWDLDRTIENQARMTGTAVFAPFGTMLKYREEGRMRLFGGKEFDAHREYRFERAPDGFTVHFEEEPLRLFHRVRIVSDADDFVGTATHLCMPDSYESSYCFVADGSYMIRHRVRGPRKDYVSTTMFTRRPTRRAP